MAEEALAPRLIIADTSAIVAFTDRRDQRYAESVAVISATNEIVIPAVVMSEGAFMVESRLGVLAMDSLLGDIERGAFDIDIGSQGIRRIRHLIRRYADLPLGYADASVIECAERRGGRILTFDHHFYVVAGEGTFSVVP